MKDRKDIAPVSSTSSIMATVSKIDDIEIPGPIINIIFDYNKSPEEQLLTSDSLSIGNLSLIKTIHQNVKQKNLRELNLAVLSGDLSKFSKVIANGQSILLEESKENEIKTIQGPSGHKPSLTTYRTALAEEDFEIAMMIQRIIGDENAKAQFKAQFPDGWEQKEKERWTPIFAKLTELTEHIRDSKAVDIRDDARISAALTQFKSLLETKFTEIATTGRHFNPHLLIQAYQLYGQYLDDALGSNWNQQKAIFFRNQVLGYIQYFLPVNYVQTLLEELDQTKKRLRNGLTQARLLKFDIFDPVQAKTQSHDYYPDIHARLGTDVILGVEYRYTRDHGIMITRPYLSSKHLELIASIKTEQFHHLQDSSKKPSPR